MRKLLLVVLLLALVLIPSALAANPHSVRGDLGAFVGAFESAFHGDWEGFVDGIVWSFPLFGLLVIVFGLTYFVAVITLFKDPDHHKYARMVAAGIALLGLAQQKVYNWILGVSTAFLIVIFTLTVIAMLLIALRRGRGELAVAGNSMYRAKSLELKAKKDLVDLKHDMKMDKAEHRHVWNSLRDLKGDIDTLHRLEGTELHQIDQLLKMLGKAYAAQKGGDTAQLHDYAKSLTNGVHTLASTARAHKELTASMAVTIGRLREEIQRWRSAIDHEGSVEQKFEHMLHSLLGTHDLGGADIHALKRENADIHYKLNQLHEYIRELVSMEQKMVSLESRIRSHSTSKEAVDIHKIQEDIAKYDFAAAQQKLGQLRRLVEQDEVLSSELGTLDTESKHLLKNISSVEHSLVPQVQDALQRISRAAAAHEGEA